MSETLRRLMKDVQARPSNTRSDSHPEIAPGKVPFDVYACFGVKRDPQFNDAKATYTLLWEIAIERRNNILGGRESIHIAPADVREWDHVVIATWEEAKRRGWVQGDPGSRIVRTP